ncbi:hypothetical protein [Magnetospirillum sp. 64-120]|uniref:hypothetical protein n=1 Tax=Magnetospirillum sp. 64-120 TaxID=1895778 RepID=UPI0009274D65|nr:hypothetical protein [Magnetospirillum sp. 64-120]OJX74768.1 MAG: hypothetical protein BGO92_14575 [Magnetospirillum sp. 64-120]
MSRLLVSSLVCLLSLGGTAFASGGGEGGGEGGGKPAAVIDSNIGVRGMVLKPADVISEPITGVRLNITQFSYPGVPERAACRTVIRVENDSSHKVAFYSLVRTFDTAKEALGTWMTPSGELTPGQSGEKLYSCKLARYMVLDRGAAGGWPNSCQVDGEERSPCPIQLTLDVNIDFLPAPAKGETGKAPAAKH